MERRLIAAFWYPAPAVATRGRGRLSRSDEDNVHVNGEGFERQQPPGSEQLLQSDAASQTRQEEALAISAARALVAGCLRCPWRRLRVGGD